MDAILKKILGVMVGILVVVLVAGGIYAFSMGGMSHGTGNQQTTNANQSQQQMDNQNSNKSGDKKPPQVVKVLPPQPKKDPRLYMKELQETINSLEEANALVMGKPGTVKTIEKTKDGTTSTIETSDDGMANTHKGIYQMGETVAGLKQVLKGMKEEINNAQSNNENFFDAPPVVYYYLPQSPQYNPGGYNAVPQSPYNNPAYNPSYPHNYNPYNPMDPNNHNVTNPNDPNNNPSQHQATGHSTGGLFSGSALNLAVTFILIISLVLGIVAVIGFIGSQFKKNGTQQQVAGQ